MDIGRIAARGKSPTRTAWVTDPIRSILWRFARPYFEAIGEEIDRCRQTEPAGQRPELLAQLRAEALAQLRTEALADLRTEASNTLASYIAGARKDTTAVTHRLAGLEEEAAAVTERVNNATAQVASQHEAVSASLRALGERVDALARGRSPHAGDEMALGHGNLVLAPYFTGTHLLIHPGDLIGRRVADGQEWEPHVRAAIERAARPDGVAVDAGAYIGIHTITMSRCFRWVHAFEPQRSIYHILCGNLALNGCANVTAQNLALYDRPVPMRLAPPEWQDVPVPLIDGQVDYGRIANAAALTFEPAGDGPDEIQAVALDELALQGVAIIKVDTQGADLRVLRGAEQTLRRCRPTVLFEYERDLGAHHGATLEGFHGFFAALDYDVTLLQEISPGRQADYLATPR